MRTRLAAAAAVIALVVGGLFAAPAAAAGNSQITVTPVVTSATYPGSAYATAVVAGDGTPPAGGTVTYSFFGGNGLCTGTATSTDTEPLNPDGTVPNSTAQSALGAGADSFDAIYNGDGATNDPSLPSTCEAVTIGQATPTVGISNLPTSGTYGGSFTATVLTSGDGTNFSVTSNSPNSCTVGSNGLTVNYVGVGNCSLNAHVATGTNYQSGVGAAQTFPIGPTTPTTPTISPLPTNATFGQNFTASVQTTGDGTTSVVSNSPTTCTVGTAQVVSFVGAGTCSLTAAVTAGPNYQGATGAAQTFLIAQAPLPATPTITNLPASGEAFGGSFMATLNSAYAGLDGVGTESVATTTPAICATNGFAVTYVGVGTCSVFAQVAQGSNYVGGSGTPQTFTIGRANPTAPTITNIPSPANEFFDFTAIVGTTGDGTTSVASSTPGVCKVASNGLTVNFVGFGACTLTPSVAQGQNYNGATGSTQTFTVKEASHGYWLVGSDGGIFSFGTAAFHGSMGSTHLQRPVVGITPTSTGNGYWLPASDGGIFSFGDSTYYGSLPGLGFHPAGSGQPKSLNAPIVGMVPTFTGHGYFMVASDGGVFAFGDARFEGSCPGIGGCAGIAVAVMPDHTGKGYWLVTNAGGVYAFGDASFYGAPPASSVPVVGAVATSDGQGYWLVYANGVVATFGDAVNYGDPTGYVNGFNPAATIFPTLDSRGYWVASARGDVFAYGDSPFLGSMAGAGLNGEIIGAFGF
jgi:hypothetical protein